MAPLSWLEIFGQMFVQFMPVWIALVIIFLLSVLFKRGLVYMAACSIVLLG